MLNIFKIVGELLTAIVKKWQSISIGGFRPFWYLVGIGLLTIFGFFLRGLLFSGAGGGSASSMANKADRKSNTGNSKVVFLVDKRKTK